MWLQVQKDHLYWLKQLVKAMYWLVELKTSKEFQVRVPATWRRHLSASLLTSQASSFSMGAPVSSPSREKGRLFFSRKGAGLNPCVCGVSRGSKLEPALWPEGGSDWPGPARGGRGHPFPALEWREVFPGQSRGPAPPGSGWGKRSLCPPHSLCPPGPQPCGGRRNFHTDSIGGRWCCGREHPDGAGTSAGALLKVQRITINRRRMLEITCLKEAQFGDGTWQLALFWTF